MFWARRMINQGRLKLGDKARGLGLDSVRSPLGVLVGGLLMSGAALGAVPTGPQWKVSEVRTLPSISVQLGREVVNPTYRMKLSDGTTIVLPTHVPVSLKGLSRLDATNAAEDTRYILEKVAQVLVMRGAYAEGLVQNDRAWVAGLDPSWKAKNHLETFDPVAEAMEEKPLGAERSDVVGIDSANAEPSGKSAHARVTKIFQFVRDAIYTSTVEAYRVHRATRNDLQSRVQEWGIQIAFRGEIQIGIGNLNVTRNFPLLLSIGFNREKRTIVFRRGIRTEKMAGGTALSVGGKFELRFYRLVADTAKAADPRAGYAGVRGQSWYPPSIPVLSPVMDSAPGYQSVGIAFGLNVSDFLPGMYLLNTVTSFQEEQRVYSAAIPEPADWLRKFHKQVSESAAIFTGHSRGARCESLFQVSYGSF